MASITPMEQLRYDLDDYLDHALCHFSRRGHAWDSEERALERWTRDLRRRLQAELVAASRRQTVTAG